MSLAAMAFALFSLADCYATGDGTPPPLDQLYFPVGLRVSAGGRVLYVANSDFDLQYNGGTLQSYDLQSIRRHAVRLLADPSLSSPSAPQPYEIPVLDREHLTDNPCPRRSPSLPPLGETCAPPVDSSVYVRDAVVIGAFATDLLLSPPPAQLAGEADAGTRSFDRLFMAVRGNATLTWADVDRDGPGSTPEGPFRILCGQDSSRRCDHAHEAGANPDEEGNTRHVQMPGEPFGIAMSHDGASIVITHQNEEKTSLFDTGLRRGDADGALRKPPSMQFVLNGVPVGGVGVAAIPHDRAAFAPGTPLPHPAFLETSRAIPEVSLIRQYPDEFKGRASDQPRPFLNREASYPVAVGAGGSDSRGIVIDPTPRLACSAKVKKNPLDPAKGRTQDVVDAELQACARKAARVFIANRTPASLLVGELGGAAGGASTYDPDRLVLHTPIPLSAGPSTLYLAPVVEPDGALSVRLFVTCFDSATVFIYNPDTAQIERELRVGLGPFAMAFDPFTLEDVATNKLVEVESLVGPPPASTPYEIRRYRFAYLASFTNSFIQVLDLDNFGRSPTFERVIYTLGRPTSPKGS